MYQHPAADGRPRPRRQREPREPAWHIQQRKHRACDRMALRLAASALRLSRHHGSAVPRILRHLVPDHAGQSRAPAQWQRMSSLEPCDAAHAQAPGAFSAPADLSVADGPVALVQRIAATLASAAAPAPAPATTPPSAMASASAMTAASAQAPATAMASAPVGPPPSAAPPVPATARGSAPRPMPALAGGTGSCASYGPAFFLGIGLGYDHSIGSGTSDGYGIGSSGTASSACFASTGHGKDLGTWADVRLSRDAGDCHGTGLSVATAHSCPACIGFDSGTGYPASASSARATGDGHSTSPSDSAASCCVTSSCHSTGLGYPASARAYAGTGRDVSFGSAAAAHGRKPILGAVAAGRPNGRRHFPRPHESHRSQQGLAPGQVSLLCDVRNRGHPCLRA